MTAETRTAIVPGIIDPAKWLAAFIYESNAIENIYDSFDLILNRIRRKSKRGHVGAMIMLESLAGVPVNKRLDKKIICDVQSLIIVEQNKKPGGHKLPREFVGQYRSCGVRVGSEQNGYRICPPADQVPELMEKLLREIYLWGQTAKSLFPRGNLIQIADFHLWFLMIHPFADGNGRTARALAYFMFVYAGLKPIIFTSGDKHETYYRCFDNPKDSSAMRQYFFSKMGFDSSGLA